MKQPHLDQQQKLNYLNTIINFLKNEKIRESLFPNFGEALSCFDFTNYEDKRNEVINIIDNCFDYI
jgi:uracil DNA glycosylase